ncbi:uncharacterized protein B0J16DRAFT_369849 [Fusarium flagelliforme]|uniref:uncharacterized protein n=1 Tax=Fusarium flagelliforme TaxID=2675880 RepID=UPI001E8CFF99|nr:uncharacterized protein B0J16DRAFT_369849 [Fusarium flagelliforme]KAH7193771.1 hypothetical protein B0J16DRAFT_369849 [Fusarium flagelliforme]
MNVQSVKLSEEKLENISNHHSCVKVLTSRSDKTRVEIGRVFHHTSLSFTSTTRDTLVLWVHHFEIGAVHKSGSMHWHHYELLRYLDLHSKAGTSTVKGVYCLDDTCFKALWPDIPMAPEQGAFDWHYQIPAFMADRSTFNLEAGNRRKVDVAPDTLEPLGYEYTTVGLTVPIVNAFMDALSPNPGMNNNKAGRRDAFSCNVMLTANGDQFLKPGKPPTKQDHPSSAP